MLLLKDNDIQAQFNDYYYDGSLPQYKAEATHSPQGAPTVANTGVAVEDVKVSA